MNSNSTVASSTLCLLGRLRSTLVAARLFEGRAMGGTSEQGGTEVNRYYNIPDVRDGLTELERIILFELYDLRKEYGDRFIPTILLWGRVVEKLGCEQDEVQRALATLGAKGRV